MTKTDNILKILHVTDIHCIPNNTTADRFYMEELCALSNYIIENPDIDMIVISGDIFNKRYMTDSEATHIMSLFIGVLLVKVAKSRKIYIRIMKGTDGHDGDQLRIFKPLEYDRYLNFKIIERNGEEEAYEEELFGLKFRYLNDVHINSYDNYKNMNLIKPCDIIFFHGMINTAIPYIKDREDTVLYKKSVVFDVNDLSKCARMFATGGHVHKRLKLAKNVWYVNSFSSNSIDDAGDTKGWDMLTIDLITKDYTVEYIPNPGQIIYERIDATNILREKNKSQTMMYFLNLVKNKKSDITLIDVDTTHLSTIELETLSEVKVRFNNDLRFKVVKREVMQDEKDVERKLQESNFMLSDSVLTEDKIFHIYDNDENLRLNYNLQKGELDIAKIQDVLFGGV